MPALRAPPPKLAERIAAVHAEIESLIAERVEAIKADCPGIPAGAIRNSLVRGNCACQAFAELERGR
jgi:hypothetical protein